MTVTRVTSWHIEGEGWSKDDLIARLNELPDDVTIEIDGTVLAQKQELL